MKLPLFFPFLLASAVHLVAQVKEAPGRVKDEAAEAAQVTERTGVENAKTQAKEGNLAQVESALTALNRAKPDTGEWYLETAQRLIQTAEQLTREGTPQNVIPILNRALEQLSSVASKGKDAEERASAKALAGFIYERYLADPEKAQTNYESAVQLAPEKSARAKEAAERLKRTDDTIKERSANKRG